MRLEGELTARHPSHPGPLAVLDISLTGFSVRSPEAFPTGVDLVFQLATGHRETTVVARVEHCRSVNVPGSAECHHVGLQLMTPTPQTLAFVAQVLEQVSAATPVTATGFPVPVPVEGEVGRVISRRKVPRFDVTGALAVLIDGHSAPVTLRDVGLGGFAVESATAFRPGTRHDVVFTGVDGFRAAVQADAVHSRPAEGAAGRPIWITGFQFAAGSTAAREAIARVIDHATACLEFL